MLARGIEGTAASSRHRAAAIQDEEKDLHGEASAESIDRMALRGSWEDGGGASLAGDAAAKPGGDFCSEVAPVEERGSEGEAGGGNGEGTGGGFREAWDARSSAGGR